MVNEVKAITGYKVASNNPTAALFVVAAVGSRTGDRRAKTLRLSVNVVQVGEPGKASIYNVNLNGYSTRATRFNSVPTAELFASHVCTELRSRGYIPTLERYYDY